MKDCSDIFDPAQSDTFHESFRELRAECPIAWHAGLQGVVVSRYADCVALLTDARVGRARVAASAPDTRTTSIQQLDPPELTVRRRSIDALAASDDALVEEFASALAARCASLTRRPVGGGTTLDLSADLAGWAANASLRASLGITPDQVESLDGQIATIVEAMDAPRDPEVRMSADAARSEVNDLIRRAWKCGESDRLNQFFAASRSMGVTEDQALNDLRALVLSVHVATRYAFENLIHQLLVGAGRLAKTLNGVVLADELLRIEGAITGASRFAKEDLRVGGEMIPKGSAIITLFASANHDEEVFEDCDEVRVGRRARRLTFAAGPHACPGRNLGLRLCGVLVDEFRAHFAGARAAGAPVRRQSATVHGWQRLPVHVAVA